MADDEQPKRGRGRPRLNPEGAVRRNVTVQVSADLYDALKAASDGSGLSISREIEARLTGSFGNAQVTDAVDGVVAEAVKAALREADDTMLADFHGQSGYMWGRLSADLYLKALTGAALEVGPEAANQISPEFVSALSAKVAAGQAEIVETWRDAALLSVAIEKLSKPGALDGVFAAIKGNDDIRKSLESVFERRSSRGTGRGK